MVWDRDFAEICLNVFWTRVFILFLLVCLDVVCVLVSVFYSDWFRFDVVLGYLFAYFDLSDWFVLGLSLHLFGLWGYCLLWGLCVCLAIFAWWVVAAVWCLLIFDCVACLLFGLDFCCSCCFKLSFDLFCIRLLAYLFIFPLWFWIPVCLFVCYVVWDCAYYFFYLFIVLVLILWLAAYWLGVVACLRRFHLLAFCLRWFFCLGVALGRDIL